ncbi:hypothetical protein [Thermocrispum municipale]|uniref:hypothetical protein n=1 Tax=Thermocrispum municipale TaxID=37926 RepID=UPI000412400B|nr:hypothetical protein [Thermocrispum municipale]
MAIGRLAKRAGAVLAAGALATAGAMATAAPASAAAAAGPGQLTVCSYGSYDSSVEFEGGEITVLVPPGDCLTIPAGGSRVESINVYGFEYPSLFWISSGQHDPSRGTTVVTYGSSAAPSASIY